MRNAEVRCRWCCSCSLAHTSSTPMWAISEDACMEVKPMSRMRTRLANSAGTGWSTGWSSSSYRTASGNPPKVLRHYLCIAAALSRGLPPPSHQPSTPLGVFVDLKCSLLLKIYDTAPTDSCKPLLSFSQVILQVTSQKSCQWILNASAGMPKVRHQAKEMEDYPGRKYSTLLSERMTDTELLQIRPTLPVPE
ncbi:unnamed protein product [Sphagnum balticum]